MVSHESVDQSMERNHLFSSVSFNLLKTLIHISKMNGSIERMEGSHLLVSANRIRRSLFCMAVHQCTSVCTVNVCYNSGRSPCTGRVPIGSVCTRQWPPVSVYQYAGLGKYKLATSHIYMLGKQCVIGRCSSLVFSVLLNTHITFLQF